jgi:hypothetical protein
LKKGLSEYGSSFFMVYWSDIGILIYNVAVSTRLVLAKPSRLRETF